MCWINVSTVVQISADTIRAGVLKEVEVADPELNAWESMFPVSKTGKAIMAVTMLLRPAKPSFFMIPSCLNEFFAKW